MSNADFSEVEHAERRLGFRLPPSVREWYSNENAIDILAKYSNSDWPIPLREFSLKEWGKYRLLPFKNENQGVCVWAITLDGSDDPPVSVDVDSRGTRWSLHAPTFSAHIYACVWDYASVLDQPALVQSQNGPLSDGALDHLRKCFTEQAPTYGWPGRIQYRFAGDDQAVLIWAGDGQADWFVGAGDDRTLDSAVRKVWSLDDVGQSLYDCSAIGKAVLKSVRGGA